MLEVDAQRLPEGQSMWVTALLREIYALGSRLTPAERVLCTNLWHALSKAIAPIPIGNLTRLTHQSTDIQALLTGLNARRLVWIDPDLRAVLRCPPFSALHTPHEVKAFGWNRAFAASFIDSPLTLLTYGPNVWITSQSICPRSGEMLKFRVMVDDTFTLYIDIPPEAEQWRVWLPLPDILPDQDLLFHLDSLRSKINIFNSQADLDTHRQYQNDPIGAVYTISQSTYLSNCLLHCYRHMMML